MFHAPQIDIWKQEERFDAVARNPAYQYKEIAIFAMQTFQRSVITTNAVFRI